MMKIIGKSINKLEIAIIGCGYVGLPLAIEFGKIIKTFAYDIDQKRISDLSKNIDANNEFDSKQLKKAKYLFFTNNLKNIKNANIFIFTIPTPVKKKNLPNLNLLKKAFENISKILKKNSCIILESTVYPGVTEKFCAKIIEKKTNYKLNSDFFIGYSPERINPGDKINNIKNISKIVSGSNKYITKEIKKLYQLIINAPVLVAKSIQIAEAAKVIENTQRDINIAFINELDIIFNKLNINIYDVLDLASTKWNFINFKPGLVGGHCIGVDPYYLSYIAKKNGYTPKIILPSRKINNSMSVEVAKKFYKNLYTNNPKVKKYKILIMGFSFKENIADFRNTKISDIVNFFENKEMICEVYDENIDYYQAKKKYDFNFILKPKKNYYDGVLICVKHNQFKNLGIKKIREFCKKKHVIFDYKNLFQNNIIFYS